MHLLSFFKLMFVFSIICLNSHVSFGAEKHALLIGINDYSLTSGVSDLKGPFNDIRLMQEVLKDKRFGFDHITVLMNQAATHSRIEKAFKQLKTRTKTANVGTVYIYYSGHGSQTRDLTGDEKQSRDLNGHMIPGFDQTWVPYGSRLKKDIAPPRGFRPIDHFDILDDQISAWLNEIAAGCDQVVFVSDSCHSGSVSRSGIATGIRQIPEDKNEHPLGRKKYPQSKPINVVRVGASKDTQTAREFKPLEESGTYGIFSWYWANTLKKCRPDDSWSHVFGRMAQIVMQETPSRQMPQISGAVTMKIFDSDFFAPSQTIPVYQVLDKAGYKHVYLAAGVLSGVTKGSVYTLEDKVGEPDAPEIAISQVAPTHSIAVTRKNINVYDQLIEISHHHQFSPTRLWIKSRHNKDKGKASEDIRKVVDALAPYEIAEDEETCDLILYLFRPDKPSSAEVAMSSGIENRKMAPPSSNENANAEIWILDKNGYLYQEDLRHSSTPEGLAALNDNLSRLARVKDIMQISSPKGASPLEITVTPMIPRSETGATCPECRPNPWPTETCSSESYQLMDPLPLAQFLRRQWDLCTIIHFNARNPTPRPFYFYVIYIGPHAEIEPVFPSIEESAQTAEVKPGAMTARGNAAIRLDTKSVDRYKLIACRKPINHYLFSQVGIKSEVRGLGISFKPNALEKILLDAMGGTRNHIFYETGSWYADTITMDMRR